jgi:hypothetical protein
LLSHRVLVSVIIYRARAATKAAPRAPAPTCILFAAPVGLTTAVVTALAALEAPARAAEVKDAADDAALPAPKEVAGSEAAAEDVPATVVSTIVSLSLTSVQNCTEFY